MWKSNNDQWWCLVMLALRVKIQKHLCTHGLLLPVSCLLSSLFYFLFLAGFFGVELSGWDLYFFSPSIAIFCLSVFAVLILHRSFKKKKYEILKFELGSEEGRK